MSGGLNQCAGRGASRVCQGSGGSEPGTDVGSGRCMCMLRAGNRGKSMCRWRIHDFFTLFCPSSVTHVYPTLFSLFPSYACVVWGRQSRKSRCQLRIMIFFYNFLTCIFYYTFFLVIVHVVEDR